MAYQVVICGAGRVGQGIAERLVEERADVTVVDVDANLIEEVTAKYDVRGVVGHASHPSILKRAGAADADMMIAVTYSDEVNLTACQVGSSLFDIQHTIARVRASEYLRDEWSDLFQRKGLSINRLISPEIEVARSILGRIDTPGAFATYSLSHDLVKILGVTLAANCPILNTPISQIRELFPQLPAAVLGVMREGKVFTPADSDQLLEGDSVLWAVDAPNVVDILDILAIKRAETRRVLIVGGGNIGAYLADLLEKRGGLRVRVIERDRARAESVAEKLKRTVVVHGDALQQEILREGGASEAEVVVAVANDDKVNILTSVLARSMGKARTIALVNEQTFSPLRGVLNVDVFVDPRSITVSTILRTMRKGQVYGLHSVLGGRAEVWEAGLLDASPLVGKSLSQVRIPDGVSLGGVIREGRFIAARESLVIGVKDKLIVFALREAVGKAEQFLRKAAEVY